jgi:hypothetical protein
MEDGGSSQRRDIAQIVVLFAIGVACAVLAFQFPGWWALICIFLAIYCIAKAIRWLVVG